MKKTISIIILLLSTVSFADSKANEQNSIQLEGLDYFTEVAKLCDFAEINVLKVDVINTKNIKSIHRSSGAYADEYAHSYYYNLMEGGKPSKRIAQVYIMQTHNIDKKYDPELKPEGFNITIRDFINRKSYKASLIRSHKLDEFIAVEDCSKYDWKD